MNHARIKFGITFSLLLLTTSLYAANVSTLVKQMRDALADGQHDSQKVNASTTIDRVQEYMIRKLDLDFKLIKQYEFKNWIDRIPTDALQAGTLERGSVREAVSEVLDEEVVSAASRRKVLAAVTELLKKKEVQFGYDASAQNGCREATPFLLVIDEATNVVSGLDLSPCRE